MSTQHLSVYIRQGREVECSSSHVSPANTYWQAPTLESPNTMYRRQSRGACVADIVRSVEHEHALTLLRSHTRALCDLIPTEDERVHVRTQPHASRVCVELRVLPPHETDACARSYRDSSDAPQDSCTLCSKSTPDVSARPHKSCLKKPASQLSCSNSLPSIHRESSANHNQSHLQLVNTHAHDTTSTDSTYTHTDKVLHKISHDLDFLLNRTPSRAADHCSQRIQEAPT